MLMRRLFWELLMPLLMHWQVVRVVVNVAGAFGLPWILFDAQFMAGTLMWWHHA